MDINQARAVLGLDAADGADEAKHAFRARARMLHPDSVAASLRPEAERAMRQLNEALQVVMAYETNGRRMAATSSYGSAAGQPAATPPPPTPYRQPVVGECDLCGWSPAKPITVWKTTGLVIFWRWERLTGDLCRVCGAGFGHMAQRHSMIAGWWGVLAFPANVVNLLRTAAAVHKHRRELLAPERRDAWVATPTGQPILVPTPLRQPGPLIATGVALLIAGLISAALTTDTATSPSGPGARPTAKVGACVTDNGRLLSCTDPSATYRFTQRVTSSDECTTEVSFSSPSSGEVYCADPLH